MPADSDPRGPASPIPHPLADGVLLIDKPSGPTSHDVVARMRRALRERSIGHTGTLDPMASGLLPLVVGRATRLSVYLTGHDKTYDATIRLGVTTDTDDALGRVTSQAHPVPDEPIIRAALEQFTGTFDQRPPAHSAKKVGGVKAYDMARQDRPLELTPVSVTVRSLAWGGRTGDEVSVRVVAAAGFYVRSLARDLGAALGCGGHLTRLRRLASGAFDLAQALPLDQAERATQDELRFRLIAPSLALPGVPGAILTPAGLARALHGNWLTDAHVEGGLPSAVGAPALPAASPPPFFKLLAAGDGRLVGLARASRGVLHPVVVLG